MCQGRSENILLQVLNNKLTSESHTVILLASYWLIQITYSRLHNRKWKGFVLGTPNTDTVVEGKTSLYRHTQLDCLNEIGGLIMNNICYWRTAIDTQTLQRPFKVKVSQTIYHSELKLLIVLL